MYILKEKSGTFTTFKYFKALVEAKSDHKLITPRSDQGSGYILIYFKNIAGSKV